MTSNDVKSARLKLGLTQNEFAFKIGVRIATVSDWETGRRHPSRMAENSIRRLLENK